MRAKMEEMEVYKELKSAPHKSIFLTADPKLIIYQESQRLVGTNGDYDFFLQKIRDSFRCTPPPPACRLVGTNSHYDFFFGGGDSRRGGGGFNASNA